MAGLISFSGIASGIDSASLIQAIIDQKRAALIKPKEERVSTLAETNAAFEKLSTLLDTLNASSSKFRAINGSVVAKTASSSDDSILSASAANSASSGTYLINVITTAQNGQFSFDDRFNSVNDVIDADIVDTGNNKVTVTIGSGDSQESVEVTLTSSSTVNDFISSFNSTSTKAIATAVNTGTSDAPSYAITISSKETGTEDGEISVTTGTDITVAGAFASSTLNQATNATFTLSGVNGTITRSSNTINDLISGVTLTLQDSGSATVSVENDANTTQSRIEEFVDAYNEVIKFVSENDLIVREENGENVSNIFAPLANTALDDNLITSLRSALSSTSNSGRDVNVLADLGITTERDGTLKFDSNQFTDAFASDPEGVQLLTESLGETLSAVDGTISQYTRFNGLIDQSKKSNENSITSLNQQISQIESNLKYQEDALVLQFSRLEGLIGKLNSQQSALAGLI